MEQAIGHRLYTLDDYLAFERESVEKHEFHNGAIVATSGGTIAHSLVASNAGAGLKGALRG